MGIGRVVIVGIGAVVVSGCASMQSGQAMDRLQSEVAMLDERVQQLEQLSGRQSADVSVIEEAYFEPEVRYLEEPSAPAASVASSPPVAIKPTIREIQQALENAGFYQGRIDGKMGPNTREAVRAFQSMNDLKVDGIVGKMTWGRLSVYADGALASGELNAAEILK